MDLIALCEGESNGQARVDAHRRTIPDEEVASAEIACDGGGLFLGQVPRSFAGAEGRRRRARGEGVVIVVM